VRAGIGTKGLDLGSDPRLGGDTKGTLFYGYIVVFFSNGQGKSINGTELAVARSTDAGKTWTPTFFSFSGGQNHFNDKPMITTDRNTGSRFRDRVYIAWDAASGGSPTGGGVLVAPPPHRGGTLSHLPSRDPPRP